MSSPAQWIGRAEARLRPHLENRRVLEILRRLRRLLERHGADRLTVDFDGFRLTGGLAERTLLLGAAEGGRESFTLSLWAALTRPGVTALDVGAHIGIFALVAARGVGPGGRVWAIEPNPQTIRYLEHNLRANGYENVTVMETAASDVHGEAVLSVPAGDRTQSTVVEVDVNRPIDSQVGVSTARLDDLLGDVVLDVVKIDTEGHEPAVLRGMGQLLATVQALIVESNRSALKAGDSSPRQLASILRAAGFNLFMIDDEAGTLREHPEGTKAGRAVFNLLAVRPATPAATALANVTVTAS